MTAQLIYYVYAYLREDGNPYYIGKGKNDRIHQTSHEVKLPPKNRRVILEGRLTELGAFAIERRLIRWHGRSICDPDGILHNIAEGGSGGYTIYTKERAEKISKALKGVTKTSEQKDRMSKARKGLVSCVDQNGNNLVVDKEEFDARDDLVGLNKNRPNTEEQKQKISEKLKGRVVSEETKQKLRGPNPKKGHGTGKKVMFFGKEYDKMKNVLEEHKKSSTWFYNKINSDSHPDCYYI